MSDRDRDDETSKSRDACMSTRSERRKIGSPLWLGRALCIGPKPEEPNGLALRLDVPKREKKGR